MKKLFTVLFAISTLISIAQTIEDAHAKQRSISAFHAIEVSSGIEVVIAKGQTNGLSVSANTEDVEQRVVTTVEDGILKIGLVNDWKFWKMIKTWRVKVFVTYTSLDELKVSSGASIKGRFEGRSLICKLNSGGTISLTGNTENMLLEANSGGMFKGYDFTTHFLEADVHTGGGAQLTVSKEIVAKAKSGGYLTYKGDAIIKTIDVNSGGAVRKLSK